MEQRTVRSLERKLEEAVADLQARKVLEADELLLMADKISVQICRRVLQRPENLIADLDYKSLDKLVAILNVQ